MIDHTQLRELIIRPPLQYINHYKPEDEEMLISISAQETEDGFYLKQIRGGENAALGIFQMEPDTHEFLWDTILTKDSSLGFKVMLSCNYTLRPKPEVMIYNLRYAAVMARIFWLHIEEPMPALHDSNGRWSLYKKYWNTYSGKATKEQFISNHDKYIGKEN